MNWNSFTVSTACYHTPRDVFEHEGVTYMAADAEGATEFFGGLVLNLTAKPHTLPSHSIPELAPHFLLAFDEIMIPCPDFGLPRVLPTFWKAIHEYIKDKGYTDVCIHCAAGHGRTGTTICALLIALKGVSARHALATVRAKHCSQAVESEDQIEYLRELDLTFNGRAKNRRDGMKGSATLERELRSFNFGK